MNKNILKSVGAVVAGFGVVFVLSVVTDLVMEKVGVFPPVDQPQAYVWWMLMVALVYRTIYTVAGGYLTARLAPSKPLKHAIILGSIGFVIATLGAAANWEIAKQSGEWYPIVLALLSLPSVWWGGKLFVMNSHKS